ncbi:MAG TPA: hypothetical protein VIU13_15605 [Chryseolinea sp.]
MDKASDRLRIEVHNDRQIIWVDYSGLKEKEMIELDIRHLELTLQTKLPFIGDYRNCYVTVEYMKQGREFVELTKEIVHKAAFLGIDKIKSYILKAICSQYRVNYKAFDSKEKAVEFLTKD